jgi:hypothetical protein
MTAIRERPDQAEPQRRGLSAAPQMRKKHQVPDDVWELRTQEMRVLSWSGATNAEMAAWFDIAESTLYTWAMRWPPFGKAMHELTPNADNRVQRSLFHNALDGNVTAQIFWLKNRRANEWRDKRDIDIAADVSMEVSDNRKAAMALIHMLQSAVVDTDELSTLIEHEESDNGQAAEEDDAAREAQAQDHGRGSAEPGDDELPEPESAGEHQRAQQRTTRAADPFDFAG